MSVVPAGQRGRAARGVQGRAEHHIVRQRAGLAQHDELEERGIGVVAERVIQAPVARKELVQVDAEHVPDTDGFIGNLGRQDRSFTWIAAGVQGGRLGQGDRGGGGRINGRGPCRRPKAASAIRETPASGFVTGVVA